MTEKKRDYIEMRILYRVEVGDSRIQDALEKLREDGFARIVSSRIRKLTDEQVHETEAQ